MLSNSVERRQNYSSPAIRDRRQRILRETRRIIAEQGIDGFSMEDVGKRAGVAKRTLYNAFQTRERMVSIAIQEYFEKRAEAIAGVEGSPSLRRNVTRLMSAGRKNLKSRNYIKAILTLYFGPDTDAGIWRALQAVTTNPNREWMEQLEATGQLQPWIDIEKLANDIGRYEYSTLNSWAQGLTTDEQLIPSLITGYLTFMAGATRGAARSEIEDMLQRLAVSGIAVLGIEGDGQAGRE